MPVRRMVLIADHHPINRQVLYHMLSGEYDILQAENGIHALSLLEQRGTEISAILFSSGMPELDVHTFLQKRQNIALVSDIPVLITADQADEDSENRAFSSGASDFFYRPYRSELLRHRLSNMIKMRTAAAGVEQSAPAIRSREETRETETASAWRNKYDFWYTAFCSLPCSIAQFTTESPFHFIHASSALISQLGFSSAEDFFSAPRSLEDFLTQKWKDHVLQAHSDLWTEAPGLQISLDYEMLDKNKCRHRILETTQLLSVGGETVYQSVFSLPNIP